MFSQNKQLNLYMQSITNIMAVAVFIFFSFPAPPQILFFSDAFRILYLSDIFLFRLASIIHCTSSSERQSPERRSYVSATITSKRMGRIIARGPLRPRWPRTGTGHPQTRSCHSVEEMQPFFIIITRKRGKTFLV